MTLADKIEAAEGPSRELDAEIAPLQGLRSVDEGHPLGRCCYDRNHRLVMLPAYTASLDAALSLVPEGWTRLIDNTDGKEIVELYPRGPVDEARIQRGSHPTSLALALVAAALRAQQEQAP